MRLLLDLAGVVTRFDPELRLARLGELAGLPAPDVGDRLYGSGFVAAADSGAFDAAGFRAALRDRLGPGAVGLDDATLENAWASAFSTDREVLDVVAAVAASGVHCGVLSNNDALLAEVLPRTLPEVFAHIDAGVFFAGAIGVAKPDPEAWGTVLRAWDVPAADVVFVDDRPEYADAATACGLHGVVFTTVASLVGDLGGLGLIPAR